jgi:predicted  nucleic acid-binding Zn-ribbon protein
MRRLFQEGQLPCSFSSQLVWEPVLTNLQEFAQRMEGQRAEIAEEQREREQTAQAIQATKQQMEELRIQLARFEAKEASHAEREKSVMLQLQACEKVDVPALLPFVQSACEEEKKVALELKSQLEDDRTGLFALKEEGTPKVGLLLNSFGASVQTIEVLSDHNSMDLMGKSVDEVKALVAGLPRDQQTVALFTHERLNYGRLPFGEHDCALCDCETPEEMANFLNENGLPTVTAETIRRSGASGRGVLLFLSAQDLQLADSRAIMKLRYEHRDK